MNPDFSPVFIKYEALRNEVDAVFSAVANQYPQCVSCRPGCSDCCNALFDLSLVEAMYLNDAFRKKYEYGRERSMVLEKASQQDRHLAKFKRELFKAEKNGEAADQIMNMAARAKARCPLLDENERCLLYEARPITCRLYGIPLAIGSSSHVCGFSKFDKGKSYPTVQLGKIQKRLDEMSAEIARLSGSGLDLSDIYVPLSMALLTNYNDAWFGTDKPEKKEER